MNWWKTIIYFLFPREKNYTVKDVLLFKRNIMKSESECFKSGKGYFSVIYVGIEKENGNRIDVNTCLANCFYLKFNKQGYIPLETHFAKGITSFRDSPTAEKLSLKFKFVPRQKCPIRKRFHYYKAGNNEIDFKYELLKKNLENKSLNLINDEIKSRMYHANLIFLGFVKVLLLNINDFISILNETELKEKIKMEKEFNLHYFKDYSKCQESLLSFIENLKRFNVESHEDSELNAGNKIIKFSTGFFGRLKKKFEDDLEKNVEPELHENLKEVFKHFIYYINSEIRDKSFILLVGENFDEIYNSIYEYIFKENKFYDLSNSKTRASNGNSLYGTFYNDFGRLEEKFAEIFFKTESFIKHFRNLLTKDELLDDYINIERIICDYYNMTAFICGLNPSFRKTSSFSGFINPKIINENDLELSAGFKIEIFGGLKELKAFDNKKNLLNFQEGDHYFITRSKKIIIPHDIYENLKINNIIIEYYEREDKISSDVISLKFKGSELFIE